MDPIDFGPATRELARLVGEVSDDDLTRTTPCPDWEVVALVDHLGGLALAFIAAARYAPLPDPAPGARPSRSLEPGWRERITGDLARLAEAWRDPGAYQGMTRAGGVDLPGEVAALVALDEVVVHGWDLARATGRAYEPPSEAVEQCLVFATSFEAPPDAPEGPFGPPRPVAASAPTLDRLVAATGREPGWGLSPR